MSAGKVQQLQLFTVDAFSSKPFTGNPAAVCPLPFNTVLSDETLQNVAMEMNLSETAFIRPLTATDDFRTGSRFSLRWFTRVVEVEMCGHATLASAAVFFYKLNNVNESITFDTLSGPLIVRRQGDSLSMNFPLAPTENKTLAEYEKLIKSLGAVLGVQEVRWCPSLRYVLVRLQDGMTRSQLEQWRCDTGEMERSLSNVVVVMVTTRGTPDQGYVDDQGEAYDFVSRCFAPWTGVPEDPVTGSAQTALAHYWNQQLGKNEFYTRQCSRRGGDIRLTLSGDRVHITGKATLVVEGTLSL